MPTNSRIMHGTTGIVIRMLPRNLLDYCTGGNTTPIV